MATIRGEREDDSAVASERLIRREVMVEATDSSRLVRGRTAPRKEGNQKSTKDKRGSDGHGASPQRPSGLERLRCFRRRVERTRERQRHIADIANALLAVLVQTPSEDSAEHGRELPRQHRPVGLSRQDRGEHV